MVAEVPYKGRVGGKPGSITNIMHNTLTLTALWPKLLVTIFQNLVILVTIVRNLVKSRNKVRFGLAFTLAKRYYIHV